MGAGFLMSRLLKIAMTNSASKNRIVGMLGGGQLGRMAALAGAPLNIRTHVLCPEANPPASHVTDLFTNVNYNDYSALDKFIEQVDTVTYEFENIPVETIEYIEKKRPVYPSPKVLAIAQDRLVEKGFFKDSGLPVTRFAPASSADDIRAVMAQWGADACIVKTTRFGYDGKGQSFVRGAAQADDAFAKLKSDLIIIEEVVNFDCEISAIVARDQFGAKGCYDIGRNEHKDHILHTTTVPSDLPVAVLDKAKALALDLAEKIGLVGVMGVEMFVTRSGGLLLNEIAPRPHNSGHWTIDACLCSQFEQQMRCVAGLPLGSFERIADAVMVNLLGDDIGQVPAYLQRPDAKVHLYGKDEAKPGRKMGHVTLVSPVTGKD